MEGTPTSHHEHEMISELIRTLASEDWQPARVRSSAMDLLHVVNQIILNRGNYNQQYVHDKLDAAARGLGYRLMGEGR
ncbi:MAG: hypothetical protein V1748_00015 [Actinomycetota bacterium]